MSLVARLPLLGRLTTTEVHAVVLGAVGFLAGVTSAWSQLRREPWYAFASFLVSLLAGIVARRRYYGQ
jgi:uncharacterized membrane protein HdeD (DUF308 family)